jgi:hypothetical protein
MADQKLYRVRLTEYYDQLADSKDAAVAAIMDSLCGRLNEGADLDYDVTIVETNGAGDEIESACEEPDVANAWGFAVSADGLRCESIGVTTTPQTQAADR